MMQQHSNPTVPAAGCRRPQHSVLVPCMLLYLSCNAAFATSAALRGDVFHPTALASGSSNRRQLRAQAVQQQTTSTLLGHESAAEKGGRTAATSAEADATEAASSGAAGGGAVVTGSRRSLLQTASDCASIVGYKTLVDVNHAGDDLATFASLRFAVGNCTANPACKGFNGANTLKSAVTPTTPSAGSCLYVKQSAECKDSNNATLAAHNKYRAMHGAPALIWSDRLASQAQVWAQYLAARDCVMDHYTGGSDGENLYGMSSSSSSKAPAANCVPAVDAWYKEVGRYRFTATPYTDNKVNFSKIGHFTQVVWKASSQLGCGAARGDGGRCYVAVCRYSSPGNYPGNANYLANIAPRKV